MMWASLFLCLWHSLEIWNAANNEEEETETMKIGEVATNWNNIYATLLPIWIFTPPCREPTTAVSATFGNRPAALSSSGGDAGAHQCPRFHFKLFAAQILGEMRWRAKHGEEMSKFWHKTMHKHLFLSIFGPVFLPSLLFNNWTSFWIRWMPCGMGVLEVGWLLIFCRSYLQLESRAGWPLFLRRGGGRCIMNDPAASFNFPLFSFLQQLLVICTIFSAQAQHVVPTKGSWDGR